MRSLRTHSTLLGGLAALAAGTSLGWVTLGADFPGYTKWEYYPLPNAANTIAGLTGDPSYPDHPSEVWFLTSAFVGTNPTDPLTLGDRNNYGSRMSGYFVPTENGSYVFYIATDDPGELWLSTDENPANKKLIAKEPIWSNPRTWTGEAGGGGRLSAANKVDPAQEASNISLPVTLVANKRYYFEALQKEGGGGDNLSLAWSKAGDAPPENGTEGTEIQGANLLVTGPATPSYIDGPQSQNVEQNRSATFTVTPISVPGDGSSPLTFTYQWKVGAANIDGATERSYTTPALQVGDSGKQYSVVIGFGGATATTTPATVTVFADTTAPTASALSSADFKHVTVTYSEPVGATAATAGNYSISGGVSVSAAEVISPTVVKLTTSLQAGDTQFTLTINNVKDTAGNALTPNTVNFRSFIFKPGIVLYGRWNNVPNGLPEFIDNHVNTRPPDVSGVQAEFVAPSGVADNYGGKLSGYFQPPQDGDYVFFVSSDDEGALYLSTDEDPANKKKIASEPAWNDNMAWVGGGNANSRGDPPANRSDNYSSTEWPDGNTITLSKSKKYYIEVLFKEGGGGDNGSATFKLASAADPANGSTALKGNVIGNYVDPFTLPPTIVTKPAGVDFALGETVTLTVVADSVLPITYQWYHNKHAVVGATGTSLVIPNAGVEAIGDYYVEVANKNGTASSFPDDDTRVLMKGAFVIEAEDYNYDGGKTVAAASTMPLESKLYLAKDGLPGIDFKLFNQSTGAAGSNGNNYRNGYNDVDGNPVDFPTAPDADGLGNVDVIQDDVNANHRRRGDFTLATNYKIGWNTGGEWYNYTRDFPAGDYNILLATSRDGRDNNILTSAIELVTGDPTKENAATTVIGTLVGNGTGAWSSIDILPYRNGDGSLAKVTLGAGKTIRVRNADANTGGGDHDLDYILLYKAASGPVVNPNPTIPGLAGGTPLTNVVIDTATKTITADIPAGGAQGYLTITPAVVITSVTIENGKLVIKYQ